MWLWFCNKTHTNTHTEKTALFPEEWDVNASGSGAISPQALYFVEGVWMSNISYPWWALLPTHSVSQKLKVETLPWLARDCLQHFQNCKTPFRYEMCQLPLFIYCKGISQCLHLSSSQEMNSKPKPFWRAISSELSCLLTAVLQILSNSLPYILLLIHRLM